MGKPASIFDDDDLPAVPTQSRPAPEQVRALSEAANFRSREPMVAPVKRPPHTYRTGRTATFAAKTTPAACEAIYAIAEQQGWKIGETLEHAVAALKRELEQGRER